MLDLCTRELCTASLPPGWRPNGLFVVLLLLVVTAVCLLVQYASETVLLSSTLGLACVLALCGYLLLAKEMREDDDDQLSRDEADDYEIACCHGELNAASSCVTPDHQM